MSPPPRERCSGQGGFSLLELLVTLIVVVLITSLVSLNVGSGGREIRLEAQLRDIASVAAYALDEAQMLGLDYGLLLHQEYAEGSLLYGYSWRERRPEGWREPGSGKDIFAPGMLPDDVELELELEGVPVAELSLEGGDEQAAPQVVLYASGETSAGAIDVRHRQSGELLWRLEWDLLGRFQLLRRGELDEET
ncbi:MAG: prepilin-type N-terminal cleavage/methylation domain-containing protein [Haliea sp.]|nr:prepilin-type N-terminal cleavage/methylation domain-containing protein [Haliea sp.]